MAGSTGRDDGTAQGASERRAVCERDDTVRLGALDDYIGFHLRLAQNASFKAFKRRTGEDDLKQGWFAVLALIGENPGITPMALSRTSGRDKSTLTPVLRELLRAHFVTRAPVPEDKRSYALFLTDTGQDLLARLSRHAAEHDDRLDRIVGAAKPEFLRLLRSISALAD